MSSKNKELVIEPDGVGTAVPPSKGKKKLLLILAPVLLCGIGGGLWFSGVLPGLLGVKSAAQAEAASDKPVLPIFVDLPDMITNLNGNSRKPVYLKLGARLEVARAEDVDRVKASMPRLQDMFQTYMREMRPEELRGSAGTYRLRGELLARASLALAPVRVLDVLFVELLVQ